MPESHSETTQKPERDQHYVALKGRITDEQPTALGEWTRWVRVEGRDQFGRITSSRPFECDVRLDRHETAPWLSRSEQEFILEALEWAGRHVPLAQHATSFDNAITLLRERLATP